jgi:hypothetical protein
MRLINALCRFAEMAEGQALSRIGGKSTSSTAVPRTSQVHEARPELGMRMVCLV